MKAIQILSVIDEKILLHESVATVIVDGKSYSVPKMRRVAKADARKILGLADFLQLSETVKEKLNYIINTF
jgi:hypothetical protein|tara:strand:+ start:319 stop:531 length:213 start_codon:yes stop_codon:yes gene_type:complete